MAIVGVEEQCGRTRTIDLLQGFRREYVRHWVVESDTPFEDPVAVSNAPGIDPLGIAYPTDARAFCVHKSAVQQTPESNRLKWLVTAKYATLTREQKKRVDFPNPLDRPYELDSTFLNITTICEKDIHGVLITNTVGQQFDPPMEKEDSHRILRVTKNYATHSGELGLLYHNAINSDTFLGAPPQTLRVRITGEPRMIEEYEVDGSTVEVEFWRRTYEFEYKKEKWLGTALNQGRYQLVAGERAKILDDDGDPVQDPVPLTEAGVAIPKGDLPGAQYFVEKEVYFELPFAELGL